MLLYLRACYMFGRFGYACSLQRAHGCIFFRCMFPNVCACWCLFMMVVRVSGYPGDEGVKGDILVFCTICSNHLSSMNALRDV